jgi:hypothetical protein
MSNAFDKTPINTATLHVPAASIDAYKTTEPWSGFYVIVELTDEEKVGITEAKNDNIKKVALYTLGGQLTDRQTKGLNILCTSNGKTKKVFVK